MTGAVGRYPGITVSIREKSMDRQEQHTRNVFAGTHKTAKNKKAWWDTPSGSKIYFVFWWGQKRYVCPCIWLSLSRRHHSDRLAGILTRFHDMTNTICTVDNNCIITWHFRKSRAVEKFSTQAKKKADLHDRRSAKKQERGTAMTQFAVPRETTKNELSILVMGKSNTIFRCL